ncbi:hypothetical protein, partial [Staphylococcus aureus]
TSALAVSCGKRTQACDVLKPSAQFAGIALKKLSRQRTVTGALPDTISACIGCGARVLRGVENGWRQSDVGSSKIIQEISIGDF